MLLKTQKIIKKFTKSLGMCSFYVIKLACFEDSWKRNKKSNLIKLYFFSPSLISLLNMFNYSIKKMGGDFEREKNYLGPFTGQPTVRASTA